MGCLDICYMCSEQNQLWEHKCFNEQVSWVLAQCCVGDGTVLTFKFGCLSVLDAHQQQDDSYHSWTHGSGLTNSQCSTAGIWPGKVTVWSVNICQTISWPGTVTSWSLPHDDNKTSGNSLAHKTTLCCFYTFSFTVFVPIKQDITCLLVVDIDNI